MSHPALNLDLLRLLASTMEAPASGVALAEAPPPDRAGGCWRLLLLHAVRASEEIAFQDDPLSSRLTRDAPVFWPEEHDHLNDPACGLGHALRAVGWARAWGIPIRAHARPVGYLLRRAALHEENLRATAHQWHQRFSELGPVWEGIRLTDHLVQLNREKSRTLAVVAHDLRSPLLGVRGLIEALRTLKPGDEAEREHIYRIMETSCHQMNQLVNDLLDMTALEAGAFSLHPMRTDLATYFAHVTELHSQVASQRGLKFTFESDDVPANAIFDRQRITQVINNLLSNALKFSPEDSEVRLRVRGTTDALEIRVTDQGRGMSEKALRHLFQPFRPGDENTPKEDVSTGLGLSIVKRIVDAHGGQIKVETAPDKGTTVIVRLPLHGPDEQLTGAPASRSA